MNDRVVTFYSYKGGVGRTMALANVAWILANNGRRVLVIDWDLEAPALHRYFRPFLSDPDLAQSPGLIDFLIESAADAAGGSTTSKTILHFASPLMWEFPDGGTLDIVSAGRQDPTYAQRVSVFDWQAFFEHLGGYELLERMKRDVEDYDFVLIDSRTGLSDIASVCTVQMPDALVMWFLPNPQSIEGSIAVARSVSSMRTGRPLQLVPALMRVEYGEKELLEQTRKTVRSRFASLEMDSNNLKTGDHIEFPYVPYYAYKEALAVFVDAPFSRRSLRTAAEDLARELTHGTVTQAGEIGDDDRYKILMAYETGKSLVGSVTG
jgi:MinD-like ATPase involved in chromosome partitioning or flagellar assembly